MNKKKYKIKWSIELEKIFEVKNKKEAMIEVENIDCQHDGEYVSNSFDIISVNEN